MSVLCTRKSGENILFLKEIRWFSTKNCKKWRKKRKKYFASKFGYKIIFIISLSLFTDDRRRNANHSKSRSSDHRSLYLSTNLPQQHHQREQHLRRYLQRRLLPGVNIINILLVTFANKCVLHIFYLVPFWHYNFFGKRISVQKLLVK